MAIRSGQPRSPATPSGSIPASAGTWSIDCEEPGAWAFHCHILPHAEGQDGMFGMVTALVIEDAAAATLETTTGVTSVVAAAAAAGSTASVCRIPGLG